MKKDNELKQHPVTRLFPAPQQNIALENLYLQHAIKHSTNKQHPCVYTNFISSLDGRIAVEHPTRNAHAVPDTITNERDWRLFQELAAQSDALITSARYVRELSRGHAQDALPLSNKPAFADLHQWRKQQGLTPQPAVVILSSSLDLPLACLIEMNDRQVYVATGQQADKTAVKRVEKTGAQVIFAGEDKQVDGKQLIDNLASKGFQNIYSIAGPGVLQTLLHAQVLNRLYLTQVHRLIGGASFDTLLEGTLVRPPADLALQALYYDQSDEQGYGQFFSIYDVAGLEDVQAEAE
jgi:riboflavin biosynthesis pyrimidine reductase